MKRKISTLIEKNIARLAKRRAAEQGRPLGDLIQDALTQFLNEDAATPRERRMAFRLFCQRPMRIRQEQFRYVLDEDMWIV